MKPVDILDYLIQFATDTTNQTLRLGAIILKKKITGKFRRNNNNFGGGGSKRSGPPRQPFRGNFDRNRNGGGRGFGGRPQHQHGQPGEDLYGNDS